MEPMHGSDGVTLPPGKPPAEMPPAAVSAYIAGMRALVAHEAAVRRGPAPIRCSAAGSVYIQA